MLANPRPFNIRIFVAEGLADGLRLVEKSNWVGLGVICPRGRYAAVKQREEFTASGVYILTGSDDQSDLPLVYIGEAETVRSRLDSHYAKKEFWQQAIVFTTRGDPLNKAEVQYLEARLVELATTHKRCRLDNANTPQRPTLSEADQAQVEGYLDEVLSLLPVLGVLAFESTGAPAADRQTFNWNGTGWSARGFETNTGFVVLKGSIARDSTVPSMSFGLKNRQSLIDNGIIAANDEGLLFTVDHEFSSPSQAATIVAGRNTNGREAWKDDRGITLKEYQQREADA
jgi:hypothetical protein